MGHILYIIFIAPNYNMTIPLVQYKIISNWPLYGVLYLYADLLLSVALFTTLWS